MIFILLYLSQSVSLPRNNIDKIMIEDKERTVVVTGCNKGIGYGLVEHLVKCPIMNVIMACRNVDKANKAKQ